MSNFQDIIAKLKAECGGSYVKTENGLVEVMTSRSDADAIRDELKACAVFRWVQVEWRGGIGGPAVVRARMKEIGA